MYQILEVYLKNRKKLGFFLVIIHICRVTYPQNFGYNTNRKYEKDIDYNSDIAIQYQRIKSGNLCMYRYLFQGANKVIDA